MNTQIAAELLQEIAKASDSDSALALGPQAVKNLRALLNDILERASPPESKAPLSKDAIRGILMSHGFKIQDGLIDLKPYVYEAVDAVLRAHGLPAERGCTHPRGTNWTMEGRAGTFCPDCDEHFPVNGGASR